MFRYTVCTTETSWTIWPTCRKMLSVRSQIMQKKYECHSSSSSFWCFTASNHKHQCSYFVLMQKIYNILEQRRFHFMAENADLDLPNTTIVIDLNDEYDEERLNSFDELSDDYQPVDSNGSYDSAEGSASVKMEILEDIPDETDLRDIDDMYVKVEEDLHRNTSVKCSICSELFDSKSKFIEHVKRKHPVVQVLPDCFACPFCHRTLKTKVIAEQHVRIHTDEKPYKCLQCGKTFTQKAGVKQHMKTHSNLKPFACPICDGRYKSASTLASHISMKHEMVKPFQCKACKMSFGHASNLNTHLRIHTGERPYQCSFCDKTFVQQGHLITHERLHTGERPFKCDYCDACFTHTGNLSQHVISQHTKKYKHRCTLCAKGFMGPSDLQRHMKKRHSEVGHDGLWSNY